MSGVWCGIHCDAVALAESLGIGQRTISFSQKSRIQIAHKPNLLQNITSAA